jgi:Protein of unknown function (DUF2934)
MNDLSFAPSFEEISARAYQLYEDEWRPEGKKDEHWARAEAELAAETRRMSDIPAQRPVEQQRTR